MPRAAWLAVGTVVAAVAGPILPLAALPLVPAAALAAVLLVRPAHRPASLALVAGALAVAARLAAGSLMAPPQQVPAALPGGVGPWSAQVLNISAPLEGQQRAIVEIGGEDSQGTVRVYAQLPRYPALAPEERIRFSGSLRPVQAATGFGDYLARSGVGATVRATALELEPPGGGPAAALEGLRRSLGGYLTTVVAAPQAGLAAGILVGLRDEVDRELADAFTFAGLSHVVAISGWNISLLGAVVSALLGGLPRRSRSLVVALFIALYTLLVGASPSVVRAAAMAGVVLLARESGRRGRPAAALGVATAAMVLLEPTVVGDAGFRLSVAATAGLLAWATPLSEHLRRHLRMVPAGVREALAISLAAQAATLPIVVLEFGRLSLIAPVANLLVAPLIAPVMLASFLGLLGGWLATLGVPMVPVLLGTLASVALGVLVAIARASAAVPFASVELVTPWRELGALVATVLVVVVILARRGRLRGPASGGTRTAAPAPASAGAAGARNAAERDPTRGDGRVRRFLLLVCGAVVALLLLVAASLPDGRLRLAILDVGQGDAILVQGDHGARLLVDTGPDPDRLLTLLDERLPPWDRRLDLVLLTHPHEDHVAGAALLLERYRVAALAEPGMHGDGPGYRAYARSLAASGGSSRTLGRGDRLHLDEAEILVRWPPRGSVPLEPPDDGKAMNNSSIVLDLRFGERRILLTGDAEEEIDGQLLTAGLEPPGAAPIDVLKVAHHGSRTATTAGLLAALHPRIAVISVGRRNDYGHPNPALLGRLAAVGARVLRTDLDGTVTLSTDGHDLQVQTSGPRPIRRRSGDGQRPSPSGGLLGPRIATWPSPVAARPRSSSIRFIRRPGSWPTPRPWPTWRPSSLAARPFVVRRSTRRSPRSPPCSTMSTRSCQTTSLSAGSGTGSPGRAG